MFDPDFLSMMGSLVTLKTFSGPDSYGAPTFATPISGIPARVVYRTRIIRTDVEDRILSTATVWMPPSGYVFSPTLTIPRVHNEDEISLPDDGIYRHVLLVTTPNDETGDYYQEIALT